MVAEAPTSSNSNDGGIRRRALLAWRWLFAGLAIFVVASTGAWWQEPGPVPLNRNDAGWSIFRPIEINPHRRLPAILDNLRTMHVDADGQHAWIAGDRGRILATEDGGGHWHAQDTGTTQDLSVVAFRKDGLSGWAGNEQIALLSTINGGRQWNKTTTPWEVVMKSAPDAGIALPKPSEDIAGSTSPLSAVTTTPPNTPDPADDRAQANRAPSELPVNFTASVFPLQAWSVGDHGTIVATADGKIWHPQTSTAQPRLNDLWVNGDGARGLAVGVHGTILATADHGATWTRQTAGIDTSLVAVTCLADAKHCWAGGENGSLIATDDGGHTWVRQNSNDSSTVTALHFSPDLKGWAMDENGTRLTIEAGANSWTRTKFVPENFGVLFSVALAEGDVRGWAVGMEPGMHAVVLAPSQPGVAAKSAAGSKAPYTRLVSTEDGGRSWSSSGASGAISPQSVSFDKTAMHGIVVDRAVDAGALPGAPHGLQPANLAITDDGGRHWRRRKLSDDVPLELARLAGDGRHGLAIGTGSQIFATDDGGLTWYNAERYRRFPAPWYWLMVALSTRFAWLAWSRRPIIIEGASIANLLAADAAVAQSSDDQLRFDELARGLSRFLRNTDTQPPLTLAITGDWGSGKSSLMQLLCADLKRFGHRPIWFNAWHHQKEEHLFASLLGAIYAQAAPPLPTIDGLSFRLRLLWVRSRHHFVLMMLAIAIISGLSLLGASAWRAGGENNLASLLKTFEHPQKLLATTFPGLLAVLTTILSITKGTKAFKANPAVLLRTAKQKMSMKTADAQNNFRAAFARQFDELTTALPYRLVLVIDDLDRCAPSAVIEVMEAVNYLTSSGKCFVIFGMATERVTAALGLAFKDIAAEMAQLEGASATDTGTEMTKRRAYATDYLQKLVNIEIRVPTGRHEEQYRLLTQASTESRIRIRSFFLEIAAIWPLALAFLAILLGIWLGEIGDPVVSRLAAKETEPTSTVSAGATSAPSDASSVTVPLPGEPQFQLRPGSGEARSYAILPGQAVSVAEESGWTLLGLLPIVAVAITISVLLWRRTLVQISDSEDFRRALAIWTPLVAARRNTPRAIKRFGNRLRYLAMLQQDAVHKQTVIDHIRAVLRRSPGSNSQPPTDADHHKRQLPEHLLIAFGALQELYGNEWQTKLDETFPPGWKYMEADHFRSELRPLFDAAKRHVESFDTAWPPSKDSRRQFECLIAGIWPPGRMARESPGD